LNPAADPALVEICLKCLRKKPEDRYASATEVGLELAHWRHDQPARAPWVERRKRLARWFAGTPELVPLIAGLIVHRLGNIQEGLFVGVALAGISLAARRSGLIRVAIATAANIIFVIAFILFVMFEEHPIRFNAIYISVLGFVAAAITLGCGWANLEARPGRWSPGRVNGLCLVVAALGLLMAILIFVWGDRLRGLDEPWSGWVTPLDRYVGRFASWFLAVPLGLAAGGLLGRATQVLNGRLWAVQLGAAVVVIVVAGIYREVRADGAVEMAGFSFLGPGAALSIAEGRLARRLAERPEVRWGAAIGIFWLKMLLLAAPVVVGGALGGLASRWRKR